MDLNEFWQLIEASRKAGACEEQAEALTELLSRKPARDILEFDKLFHARMLESYRWDLWAVAYIVNGGCSDDGFDYFRAWLIGQGRAYFEAALGDAGRAADNIKPGADAECEDLLYAASSAYESVTGRDEMPAGGQPWPKHPAGDKWEEEALPELYPELCKRFDFE